jgi:hypothetical protein
MSGVNWILSFVLISLYIICLFTVCVLTFRKGRTVLGIVGIFIPLLWLIGAVLPPKKESRYELNQEIAYQRQLEEYTR